MLTPERDIMPRRRFLRKALLAGALPLLAGCAGSRQGCTSSIGSLDIAPDRFALPNLDDDRIVKFIAGVRPYRSGRVRIEREQLDGRPFVHNYGHGGAGLTLSWGSAVETLGLVRTIAKPGSCIAVLGAGVIGLTTAAQLLQRGYRVQLYTRQPIDQTTSWLAGGQWSPSLVARGHLPGDEGFFHRLLKVSHDCFSRLANEGSWGVYRRPNLVAAHGGGGGLQHVPPHLLAPIEQHDELPLTGLRYPGTVYHTMLIEPPVFLTRLLEHIALLGGETVTAHFTSLQQLRDVPGTVVVNCLGMGARDVLHDAALVPMKGNLVYMQPQHLPYLLSHGSGYMFPRSDALVLGGSVQRGDDGIEPDEAICRRILQRHRHFFSGDPVA